MDMNKYVSAWKYYSMDKRDLWEPKDVGNV